MTERVCSVGIVFARTGISGASRESIENAKHLVNPNALILGFARRFATYKRANLLLHDPMRLQRLLSNPERPVQVIIAGKAHPEERAGQAAALCGLQCQGEVSYRRNPHLSAPRMSALYGNVDYRIIEVNIQELLANPGEWASWC